MDDKIFLIELEKFKKIKGELSEKIKRQNINMEKINNKETEMDVEKDKEVEDNVNST